MKVKKVYEFISRHEPSSLFKDDGHMINKNSEAEEYNAIAKSYTFAILDSSNNVVSITSKQIFELLEIIYNDTYGLSSKPDTFRRDVRDVALGARSNIRKHNRRTRKIDVKGEVIFKGDDDE